MDKVQVNELVRQRLVHEIHTSERKSFRGCRRRWDWVFRQYYYPKTTAKPLEFGTAFHAAMEVLYHPDTWKFDRQIVINSAVTTFVAKCEAQKKIYLDFKDIQEIDDPEAVEDYAERVELGKGMLKYYAEKVAPIYDKGWTPVKVEVEFIVPIQNPDTDEYLFCTCNVCWKLWFDFNVNNPGFKDNRAVWEGLPVCLAGRIDMLAEDTLGNYWIVDWKTAAALSKERDDSFLYLDDQISSYVMALRRKLGLNVRGFLYVEIRKGFPEAPARNKSERMGKWYSVNKNQATDYATYLATIKEHDTVNYEAGNYDEFLTFLENEGIVFSYKYQIMKSDEELRNIEMILFMEASDMIDQNIHIYPNPGKFNCGYCAFRQPCIEMNMGGDYIFGLEEMFEKRKKHYWVQELSTDKRGGE